MKKVMIGLGGGVIGAAVNVLFLLSAPNLETEVYLSTVITWLVIGVLISSCNFQVSGVLKGVIVSLLVSASSLIYTATSSVGGAIWTLISTLVCGAVIGYVIGKVSSKMEGKS